MPYTAPAALRSKTLIVNQVILWIFQANSVQILPQDCGLNDQVGQCQRPSLAGGIMQGSFYLVDSEVQPHGVVLKPIDLLPIWTLNP